jgi:hypothetical protein
LIGRRPLSRSEFEQIRVPHMLIEKRLLKLTRPTTFLGQADEAIK